MREALDDLKLENKELKRQQQRKRKKEYYTEGYGVHYSASTGLFPWW